MLYWLETVALTKRQEAAMEVAELKMLRFSLGVTRPGMGTPEGLHGGNGLVRNQETQDRDGMDMYGGEIMGILGEGC